MRLLWAMTGTETWHKLLDRLLDRVHFHLAWTLVMEYRIDYSCIDYRKRVLASSASTPGIDYDSSFLDRLASIGYDNWL